MEVVGEQVPELYFGELDEVQRLACRIFAAQLAMRFELVSGITFDRDNLPDDPPPIGPNYTNLSETRLAFIELFGVDPLRVLPGQRPSPPS